MKKEYAVINQHGIVVSKDSSRHLIEISLAGWRQAERYGDTFELVERDVSEWRPSVTRKTRPNPFLSRGKDG